ncbi:DUF6634 family protein [Microvirga yunnanensis]|uniref:DUF6634 family protein n=1 Tax=Microvirga yunnanensis TaxID=2953740 RepID=UPI0021C84BB4|nr:DUF6634 family protein [Microvirga sp. HBU67655]
MPDTRMPPEAWDRLVAGWQPSEVDLLRAPILSDWYPVWRRGALVVVGRVSYHHKAADGTVVQTTPVLRMAEDETWLRTRREYFRLGKRFERKPIEEIVEAALGPAAPGSVIKASDRLPGPDWDPYPDLPLPPVEDDDDTPRP